MLQPSTPPSLCSLIHLSIHSFNPINKDEEGQLGPLDTPGTDLLPFHPLVLTSL